MAHHVIYVPGIGDHHSYGQDTAIQLWCIFGLKPHYFPLGWNIEEGFKTKLEKLNLEINSLHSKGHDISLVGVSAGASAALNAFASNRNVTAVALICGKVNHPETVSTKTYSINPDFKQSMSLLQTNLRKMNLLELPLEVSSSFKLRLPV